MFCRKGYFFNKYNQGCKAVLSLHHLPPDQLRSHRLSCEQQTESIDILSKIGGEGGETERDGYRVCVGEVGGGVNRGCSGGGPGNTTDPPLGDTTITIQLSIVKTKCQYK